MSAELWMWLAAGLGYGAVNSGELLAEYPGGAGEIADSLGSSRMDELLTQKQADRLAGTRPQDYSLILAHAATLGVHPISYEDPLYPALLKEIHNPPPVLFAKGDMSLFNGQLSIGIVGARRPSAYGVEATKAIGRGVALGGAIIVSGLAAGLDAEAHKAALAVNGPTIACIAFGHDTCYPQSNKKLMELVETYGVVVSEYPIGTKPEKPYFLQRNRLIAGLSHGLVVCEARSYSGTMSTVNYAADYGRDVFAVPGSIFSSLSTGTNGMIREGAYLAAGAKDVLAVYGIEYEEDEAAQAAQRQAMEGRPTAQNAPEWMPKDVAREVYGGQQDMTMAEALQAAAGKTDAGDRVSAKQAVDAFVKLQKNLVEADGEDEVDDRQARMLQEMAAAVSDSVETAPRPAARDEEQTPRPGEAQAYSWAGVEHISREDLERQTAETIAERGEQAAPRAIQRPLRPQATHTAVQPVAPVEGIGAVQAVEGPAYGVAEEAVYTVREYVAPAQQPAPQPPPVQQASRQQDRVDLNAHPWKTVPPAAPAQGEGGNASPPDRNISAQKQAEERHINPGVAKVMERLDREKGRLREEDLRLTSFLEAEQAEEAEKDPREDLSEAARKALAALGANPKGLGQIVEESGLGIGDAMAALTELELAGFSRQLAGRQFIIMQ